MISKKLSIILVNYNLAHEADVCLESLLKFTDPNTTEIIVVDNGSTDKGFDGVVKKYEGKVQFFSIEKNLGFGGGNNYGASKANGEILCLLNTDTIIRNTIFNKIITLFEKNPEITILGPRLRNLEDVIEYSAGEFPTLCSELYRVLNPGGRKSKFYLDVLTSDEPVLTPVDWVTGAALFVRRDAFENAGGFDKNIFMYNEEVDLCKRISLSGGTVWLYPADGITHIKSVGSRKNYYLFTVRSYESKLYYLEKHFGGLKGLMIRKILALQVLVQLIIWTLMYPAAPAKSADKLRGFSEIFGRIMHSLFNLKLLTKA